MDISNRFKGLEDKANSVKEIVIQQNNDIKRLYLELVQLKREGDLKFETLIKKIDSGPTNTSRDCHVRNESQNEKSLKNDGQKSRGNFEIGRNTQEKIQYYQNPLLVDQRNNKPAGNQRIFLFNKVIFHSFISKERH